MTELFYSDYFNLSIRLSRSFSITANNFFSAQGSLIVFVRYYATFGALDASIITGFRLPTFVVVSKNT